MSAPERRDAPSIEASAGRFPGDLQKIAPALRSFGEVAEKFAETRVSARESLKNQRGEATPVENLRRFAPQAETRAKNPRRSLRLCVPAASKLRESTRGSDFFRFLVPKRRPSRSEIRSRS